MGFRVCSVRVILCCSISVVMSGVVVYSQKSGMMTVIRSLCNPHWDACTDSRFGKSPSISARFGWKSHPLTSNTLIMDRLTAFSYTLSISLMGSLPLQVNLSPSRRHLPKTTPNKHTASNNPNIPIFINLFNTFVITMRL